VLLAPRSGGPPGFPFEASPMKIDAGFEGSLEGAARWASRVEQSGLFGGLWVSDTTNDPFQLSALLSLNTDSVTVGTNIAVAFARSPYCLAQTAYNLAQISKGRFFLGLGTQIRAHIQKRFSMSWPDKPVAALVEYVALLRHLFDCFESRERPEFRGEYFSCSLNSPVFTPDRHEFGAPRVGFSAVGPKSTEAAGRFADAVFLHPFTHLKYLRDVSIPALQAGKRERDPSLGELEIVGSCFCVATDASDVKERRQSVFGRLAFYASTPNYSKVLTSLGMPELHAELHQLSKRGEWTKMAQALPTELIEACVVMAPKSGLREALENRFAGVYDRVVIDPASLL
jgi:probable F420-dependent oxidoreductase